MHVPNSGLNIIKLMRQYGYEAYFVGGCVRDCLLGITPNDWDICTNAVPSKVIEILSNNNIKYHTVGIEFGTVTALCKDNEYEITTYRKDGEYTDNRRPTTVELVTNLDDDLSRRDFTINAMAYDPLNKRIIDRFGGIQDLKHRRLVAVGDADRRFKEDALRILRALRFAIKYNLEVDEDTDNAIKDNYKLLDNISKERITSELEKILTSGESIVWYFLRYDYIIGQIIPELKPCFNFDQNSKYHKHDIYEHILYVVDACKSNKFEIRLAALLHDIGKPNSYVIGKDGYGHFYGHPDVSHEISVEVLNKRLRLTKEQSERVLTLVKYHDMTVASTKASVKRAMNKLGLDTMIDWCILKQADMDDHIFPDKKWKHFMDIGEIKRIMQEIIDEQSCFSLKDLAINGNDIIRELHIKPGKTIGVILNSLLNEVIDEQIENSYDKLLLRAKELKLEDKTE